MIVNRQSTLSKGSSKTLFESDEAGAAILSFEDRNRYAKDNKTLATLSGKGILNNRISAHLMTKLEGIGLPTHFLKSLNMREQLVRRLDAVPFVVRVRNIAAGSIADRLDLKEGTVLPRPIVEFFYKKAAQDYTLVTDDHIMAFQWADPLELEEIVGLSYRANDYLNGLFAGVNVRLVDFTLEFGRLWGDHGELYLMIMDELSPDTMRLWDIETNTPFYATGADLDPANVVHRYQDLGVRLGLIPKQGLVDDGGELDETLAKNLGRIENLLATDKDRKMRSVIKMPPRKTTH